MAAKIITRLYPGYGLTTISYAKPYPGYRVPMMFVLQTIPWDMLGGGYGLAGTPLPLNKSVRITSEVCGITFGPLNQVRKGTT